MVLVVKMSAITPAEDATPIKSARREQSLENRVENESLGTTPNIIVAVG